MDAKQDRPWLRTGFRHENLRGWATENRGLLAWAALTLIRAWIVRGKPKGTVRLGMFESWSDVMGGILAVAGIPGFLTNLDEFYEKTDTEGANWRAFLAAWWDRFCDGEVLAADLHSIAIDSVLPLGDGKEQSQKIILGKLLASHRDRTYDLEMASERRRLVISQGGKYKRATLWQLRQVSV